jgi:hypothetical protein
VTCLGCVTLPSRLSVTSVTCMGSSDTNLSRVRFPCSLPLKYAFLLWPLSSNGRHKIRLLGVASQYIYTRTHTHTHTHTHTYIFRICLSSVRSGQKVYTSTRISVYPLDFKVTCKIEVFMAVTMKNAVFSHLLTLVPRSRIFLPEDGSNTFLRNVGSDKIYKAPHPRRRHSLK